MLILHISDIHFSSPECLRPDTDPDFAIRTRMMRDLAQQVGVLGEVGAIIVGGDIAYKAAAEEYEVAWTWLQELAEISGCPKERIFVVPGNHDVDRKMIGDNISIQNVQHAIATAPSTGRERTLRQQLGDAEAGQNLLKAHSAYNAFAAPMACQIWPGKPYWHQDVDLGGGVNLRVHGLTSTLLSGQKGADDRQGGLYLSPLQTVLNPAPNTANLVVMHHPPDWLADGEDVDDALQTRAIFHLFGHKHKQRAVLGNSYVRLGAGAVNPSRAEKPYDPGYNLININVEGAGKDRTIKVELHQRRLQDNPELFVAIKTQQGEDVFRASIPLPEEAPLPKIAGATSQVVEALRETEMPNEEPTSREDAEAAMGEADTRDLLFRFWRLTSSQRRTIIQDLKLLEQGEIKLPEPERYGRALIRAGEREILKDVAAAVAKLENK